MDRCLFLTSATMLLRKVIPPASWGPPVIYQTHFASQSLTALFFFCLSIFFLTLQIKKFQNVRLASNYPGSLLRIASWRVNQSANIYSKAKCWFLKELNLIVECVFSVHVKYLHCASSLWECKWYVGISSNMCMRYFYIK